MVDDGLATGPTMRAAVSAVRSLNPTKIIVAVPVAPQESIEEFSRLVDKFVYVDSPRDFHSVGWWYRDFSQTEDEEVRQLLDNQKIF